MNARKFFLIAMLFILAIAAVACASAPTPTTVPTPIPPTAAPKPTEAPKPTVAPTAAPTTAPTVVPSHYLAPIVDIKPALDKYISSLPDGFGTIAPAALKDQLAMTKVFVLDVREPSEIAKDGFIEGSVNIPVRTLTKNLDKLPAKDQPIVTLCAVGHRGAVAMETLQLLGYTNVKSLVGGFNAWKDAKLPVATGTPAAPVAGKAPDVDKDLLASLDKYVSGMPDNFYTIAPAALKEQMAATKVFLLDVRETSEVAQNGAIEGSVTIPIRSLFKDLTKLPTDKSTPIVTYCAIGHRGAMAMQTLQLLGYTNVKSIVGGFTAWKAANLPVVGAPFDMKALLDKYFSALPEGYYNIAPAAAADQMKATKTFLLDVREPNEITTNGYIEGAVNIPVRTLIKNLGNLPADKAAPIIVTCGSGVRSPMAMEALQLLGYTNVKNLQGGFGGWKNANLPIAMGSLPAAPMAAAKLTFDKDLVAALDTWFSALPDGFNNVAPAAINDQLKVAKVTVIDVREASEFATGYIEGSKNVPVRTLIKNLPADKTAPVIITCASGHRGMMGLMAMSLLGYTNVKNISGGVNSWKNENLPVVTN